MMEITILKFLKLLGMEKKKTEWEIPTFLVRYSFDIKSVHHLIIACTILFRVCFKFRYLWPSFVYLEEFREVGRDHPSKLNCYIRSRMLSAAAVSACSSFCMYYSFFGCYTLAWACTNYFGTWDL